MTEPSKSEEANSLLETVKTGNIVATSLVDLTAKYITTQRRIQEFTTEITITSTLLTSLSSLLSATPSLPNQFLNHICAVLCKNYEKISKVVQEVEKERDTILQGVEEGEERRVWGDWSGATGAEAWWIFRDEVGGEVESEKIIEEIESVKMGLWYLVNVAQYNALRELEKGGKLEDESKKEELKKLEKMMGGVLMEFKQKIPGLLRMAEQSADMNGPGLQRRVLPNQRARRGSDVRSFMSFDSTASEQYLGIDSIYETWIWQAVNEQAVLNKKASRFFGFKIHETETYDNGSSLLKPKSCSQEEMKAKYDEIAAAQECSVSPETIAALPPQARRDLHFLLQDREFLTSDTRYERAWKLVALEPIASRLPLPSKSWGGWWKGQPEKADILIVIKGETIDAQGMTRCTRQGNPFRKPLPRREQFRRERIREEPVIIEERRYQPSMDRTRVPCIPVLSQEEINTELKEVLVLLGTGQNDSARDGEAQQGS